MLAPEALAGFRAAGLNEWAEVLAEAMQFFGTPYPRDRGLRQSLLPTGRGPRRKWDPFYALDDRFYAWLNAVPDGWPSAPDHYAAAGGAA